MKSFKRTVLWTLGVIVLMAVFFYGSTETTAGAAAEPQILDMDKENGRAGKNGWYQKETGEIGYFDENGCAVTGFHLFDDGKTRFFDEHGSMMTGLIRVNGRVFYLDIDGAVVTGAATVNGTQYVFTREGIEDPEIMVSAHRQYHLSENQVTPEAERHFGVGDSESFHLPAYIMLLLALVLLTAGKKRGDRTELFFLYAAVLFSSTPLFLPYLIKGHDSLFHLSRILGIRDSLRHGMFPVRLNSFAFNGYGYGEPLFYPNLFLYIPALFMKLGIPMANAVQLWLLLCNGACAAIMYICAGRLFHSRTTGCLSSILYTLGIYRLGNCYNRAAYGEFLAMIFLPLVIYGFYELFFGDERRWTCLAAGLTGVFQSHIITAALVTGGCCLAGLLCIKQILVKKRFAALVKMLLLTLCINLWFMVPLADSLADSMDGSAGLDRLWNEADKHALTLSRLLTLFPIDYGEKDGMALGLGFPILAAAGLLMLRQIQKKPGAGDGAPSKMALLFLLLGGACAFVSLSLFPWKYLMKWELFRLGSSFLQFPWRFLGPALCFLSMAGGYGICLQWGQKHAVRTAAALLCVCITCSQHFLDSFYQNFNNYWTEKEINSISQPPEYLYPDANRFFTYGWEFPSGDGLRILSSKKEGLSVEFSYDSTEVTGGEACADLPLFYYPNYCAEDSGGQNLPVIRSESGLARVLFAPGGQGRIRVFYREPWLWRACEAVSAGAAAAFLFICLNGRFRRRRRPSDGGGRES